MPPSEGGILDATGLERRYGSTRVLRGVDLHLAAGEALVVAGPNGAGKTTLLRCLAGLLRPSAGEVRVLGRRVHAGDPESRRPIGWVSHRSLLYDDLTLAENLRFAARLYGVPKPDVAVRGALEAVGLLAQAERSPRQLSRGTVQRAAIARALLQGPALLLLDEPFTGLDASAADGLRGLLRAALERGAAAVVVTHRPEEAWPIATQAAALVGGRWATSGPRPSDPAVFSAAYRAAVAAHG
jgi:heme ABC exporter ATP-binding subunit CcmA